MKRTAGQKEYKKQIIIRLYIFFHFLVSAGLFVLFEMLFRYGKPVHLFSETDRLDYLALAGYVVILIFFNRTYNSYLLGFYRIRTLAAGQIFSHLLSLVVTYFISLILTGRIYNFYWFLALFAVNIVVDLLWSLSGNNLYFALNPAKKTLLIYRSEQDKKRFGNIGGKPMEKLYTITAELKFDGQFSELAHQLEGYEAVFVAGVNSKCRNGIMKYCKENGVSGFFLPHIGDLIMQEAEHIKSFDSPVLFVARTSPDPEYLAVKRLFDIVFSLFGLVLFSPVILITALAVKICDRGPVLYKQTRLTRDGREFRILKFRSMRVDAEGDGVARLSTGENDSRITPVGKFIRKTRIDELPQLINILKGDMSFVGPRPERPEIARQYCETIPDFKLRLQVKAGLTGYAQVYGKYNTDPYEKLEFDLMYINNMSFTTDLRLIFATLGILLKSESTEGVDNGQVTAMFREYDDDVESMQAAADNGGVCAEEQREVEPHGEAGGATDNEEEETG